MTLLLGYYLNNVRFSTTFNKTCLRELKKLRTLEGQVESMTVKNVQLYNLNKEKDKEIENLRNHNFKEWFEIFDQNCQTLDKKWVNFDQN